MGAAAGRMGLEINCRAVAGFPLRLGREAPLDRPRACVRGVARAGGLAPFLELEVTKALDRFSTFARAVSKGSFHQIDRTRSRSLGLMFLTFSRRPFFGVRSARGANPNPKSQRLFHLFLLVGLYLCGVVQILIPPLRGVGFGI